MSDVAAQQLADESESTESLQTEPKPEKHWLFKPGESGNPAGRPKGSRNQLTETFLKDLNEVWQAQGRDALDKLIQTDPGKVVQAIVQLAPKQAQIEIYDRTLGDTERLERIVAIINGARARDDRPALTLESDLGADGGTADEGVAE